MNDSGAPVPDDPVLVLRQAVAAAVTGWGRLPDPSPDPTSAAALLTRARGLLSELMDALAPVRDALADLVLRQHLADDPDYDWRAGLRAEAAQSAPRR